MGLNASKGNMYEFITDTFNVIKGQCYHDCTYCYMKRWNHLKPVRFDESELKTDLGYSKFIFVGSSCDMFANDIPNKWITRVLDKCKTGSLNQYLFQSKDPGRMVAFEHLMPADTVLCTTLESNKNYPDIMGNSPPPIFRAGCMALSKKNVYITIEPVLDFDIEPFVEMIKSCDPVQVNIGADSGGHKMPEPSREKLLDLTQQLKKFTRVEHKKNLKRLLK